MLEKLTCLHSEEWIGLTVFPAALRTLWDGVLITEIHKRLQRPIEKKKRWKKPTKIAFVSCDRLVNNHCKLLNTVQYSFKNEWNQTQNSHIM